MVSKAPSFKPEVLSSLPVSPGPEFVTVVRGLRGYDGPSHGGPGRYHCISLVLDGTRCRIPLTLDVAALLRSG